MTQFRNRMAFTFCVLASLGAGISPARADTSTYRTMYDLLTHPVIDPTRVAPVRDVVLRRDAGTFTMTEGLLYACRPLGNRVWAMVFTGTGRFTCVPPTAVEREQLLRYTDRTSVDEPFRVLVLLFTDSTCAELEGQVTFSPAPVPKDVSDHLAYAVQFLSDGGVDEYYDASFMTAFLEGQTAGLFLAHFSETKLQPMMFRVDPYDVEEVRFGRRDMSWPGYRWELINQFHTQEEYATGADREDEAKDPIRIARTTIHAEIESDLDLTASARLVFTSLTDRHWIRLELARKLDVDSVVWAAGSRAEFVDGDEHQDLWIAAGERIASGQVCSLTVYYHGDIMEQDGNARLYLLSSNFWYPRDVSMSRGRFDMTFRYPSRYTFLSVGNNVETRTEGDRTVTHWVTSRSVKSASFNFGLFRSYPGPDSTQSLLGRGQVHLPPTTVFMSEGTRMYHGFGSNTLSGVAREDMVREIGQDIAASTGFFTELLGPPVFDALLVGETPRSEGEAFPGLVNLSWVTYELASTYGEHRVFRAHEVAHQWWGIGVGFKTYHDQWLSEGFCEYLGGWYLQAALRDNALFFRLLGSWRTSILNNRDYLLGKGREAGPIWLGYRTLSRETEDDYDLIIYKKAALVLHMLRNMLLDLNTLNEDQFRGLMSGFYREYRNSRASTRDFQMYMEKYLGADMGWFFNQWIYGTAIPFYQFAHSSARTDSGYVVSCRVSQQNVPPEFRVFVPIQVKTADGKEMRVRVLVTGAVTECVLPPVPSEPVEVVFNYLDSVLCGAEEVGW
jgi:hypothetical protein